MLHNTDVLDVCADMLQRCGLTAGHLAQHMGAPMVAPPAKPLQADRVLARADCPAGVTSADLQQEMALAESTVSALLRGLKEAGQIVRLKLSGARAIRWFASEGAMRAYQLDHTAVKQAAAPVPAQRPQQAETFNSTMRVTAGASRIAPQPVGEVITPANVKRTVAATPRGRYEAAPGEAMSGGFMAEWQAKRAGAQA